LCDVIEHDQAARTQIKHCSNIVGRVCGWRCLAKDLHVRILRAVHFRDHYEHSIRYDTEIIRCNLNDIGFKYHNPHSENLK
jgi:hypothetical protein